MAEEISEELIRLCVTGEEKDWEIKAAIEFLIWETM